MKNFVSALVMGSIFSVSLFAAETVVAPKVIYHFGKKEHLVQNAELGNVPENVWNDSIMGEKTKYKLLPFRRGLYGTTHPAYAETFGSWVMEVTIKDECRTSEKTAVISDLLENARFKQWFPKQSEFKSLKDFTAKCFVKTKEESLLAPRLVANLQNVHPKKEGACERIVEKYLNEEKITLVLDEQWVEQEKIEYNIDSKLSWYIRDRSCIEKVRAKPEEMISIMNAVPMLWKYTPTANNVVPLGVEAAPEFQSNGIAEQSSSLQSDRAKIMVRILMDVFTRDTKLESEEVQKLKKAAATSDIYWVVLTSEKIGVADVVPKLAEARLRCQKRGQFELFRKTIEQFDQEENLGLENAIQRKPMEQYAFSSAARVLASSLAQICR